jgi:hypothetical protein
MISHMPNNLHKSNIRYNTTLDYFLQTIFAFPRFYYASLTYFCTEKYFMTLNAKLNLVSLLTHHPPIHQNAMTICA